MRKGRSGRSSLPPRDMHGSSAGGVRANVPKFVPLRATPKPLPPVTQSEIAHARTGLPHRLEQPLKEVRRFFKRVMSDHELEYEDLFFLARELTRDYADARVHDVAHPLPVAAPELWSSRDLNRRETPADFILRVYDRWIGHGLTRKDIKELDPDLYRALSVWVTRHPEDPIASKIPKQSDLIDKMIDRLLVDYPLEELRKLGYAIDARLKRLEPPE
jgi:hypothetical protein